MKTLTVITANNKKLFNIVNINIAPPCSYRIKNKCPLNGKCRTRNILYKYMASTSKKPEKVYLGTAAGDFK